MSRFEMPPLPGSKNVSISALVKGEERYIFLFDDTHKTDLVQTFGRFAANPELSFDWEDATKLARQVK